MRPCSSDLLVHQVAIVCGCHPNTVRNADRKGIIRSQRDYNNYRRFTWQEAMKLKAILNWRSGEPMEQYTG